MYVKVPVQMQENVDIKGEKIRNCKPSGFQLVSVNEANSGLSIEPKEQKSSLWDTWCNNKHLGREMLFKVS